MKRHFIFVIIFCNACFSGFTQSSITIEPTTSNQLKLRGNGNGGYWPSIIAYRSLGTSVAPAAVQSGNWLLSIDGLGYTGSGYSNPGLGATGAIQIVAAENFTPTATGTLIRFSTTANGTVLTPTERMRINHNGNVGIGNTNPTTAKLVISGTAGSQGLDLSSTDQYANVRVLHNTNGTADKDLYFGFQSGATSSLHLYSNNSETVTIKGNKMGIGTVNPVNKLDVLGTIRANELIIESNWADYVFEKSFRLKPLAEVENFIKENKHLPDVPSAKTIQENGAYVSELMTKMMQKIEELTLYSIQQEKKIEALEKRLEEVKK